MGFTSEVLDKYSSSWQKMLDHPFLKQVADGSIPDERFANWLRQDYVFVREAIPFVALMIPKAPLPHRKALADTMVGFNQELGLFERMAAEHGVDLQNVVAAPTNRGYIDSCYGPPLSSPTNWRSLHSTRAKRPTWIPGEG